MRKKTQLHLFDNIFWYFIYILPLILLCISMISVYQTYDWTSLNVNDIWDKNLYYIMTDTFGMMECGVIWETIHAFIGDGGYIQTFVLNDGVIFYLTYFVSMVIAHLAVDFILFIPRLAHKFMNKFTQGD